MKKGLAKAKPFKKLNYFVSHRIYSWQVAPQQSLLPLGSGINKINEKSKCLIKKFFTKAPYRLLPTAAFLGNQKKLNRLSLEGYKVLFLKFKKDLATFLKHKSVR